MTSKIDITSKVSDPELTSTDNFHGIFEGLASLIVAAEQKRDAMMRYTNMKVGEETKPTMEVSKEQEDQPTSQKIFNSDDNNGVSVSEVNFGGSEVSNTDNKVASIVESNYEAVGCKIASTSEQNCKDSEVQKVDELGNVEKNKYLVNLKEDEVNLKEDEASEAAETIDNDSTIPEMNGDSKTESTRKDYGIFNADGCLTMDNDTFMDLENLNTSTGSTTANTSFDSIISEQSNEDEMEENNNTLPDASSIIDKTDFDATKFPEDDEKSDNEMQADSENCEKGTDTSQELFVLKDVVSDIRYKSDALENSDVGNIRLNDRGTIHWNKFLRRRKMSQLHTEQVKARAALKKVDDQRINVQKVRAVKRKLLEISKPEPEPDTFCPITPIAVLGKVAALIPARVAIEFKKIEETNNEGPVYHYTCSCIGLKTDGKGRSHSTARQNSCQNMLRMLKFTSAELLGSAEALLRHVDVENLRLPYQQVYEEGPLKRLETVCAELKIGQPTFEIIKQEHLSFATIFTVQGTVLCGSTKLTKRISAYCKHSAKRLCCRALLNAIEEYEERRKRTRSGTAIPGGSETFMFDKVVSKDEDEDNFSDESTEVPDIDPKHIRPYSETLSRLLPFYKRPDFLKNEVDPRIIFKTIMEEVDAKYTIRQLNTYTDEVIVRCFVKKLQVGCEGVGSSSEEAIKQACKRIIKFLCLRYTWNTNEES